MPKKRHQAKAKQAITLRLSSELVDAFRTFCRDHAGKPLYLSPASFAEEAISQHLIKLRREVGALANLQVDHQQR